MMSIVLPPCTFGAHGKCLLFGEYSVLKGFPSLLIPLNNLRLEIEASHTETTDGWENCWKDYENKTIHDEKLNKALLNAFQIFNQNPENLKPVTLKIKSSIPIGKGLGSSAAFCVALTKIFTHWFQPEKIHDSSQIALWATQLEHGFHGTSSGGDIWGALHSQAFLFHKGEQPVLLKTNKPFVLGFRDSLQTKEKHFITKIMAQTQSLEICELLGAITEEAIKYWNQQDLNALGQYMDSAQNLLKKLGVSTENLNNHCKYFKTSGALGAKLLGAGGGGFSVGLFPPNAALPGDISFLQKFF